MSKLLQIICLISIFLIGIGGVIETLSDKKEITTKCFDKFGSEIIDMKCTKKIFVNDSAKLWSNIFIFGGILQFLITPLVLFSLFDSKEDTLQEKQEK